MNSTLIIIARSFYAVALVFFGVQQCVMGKLIAGRPLAWSAQTGGEAIIAYASGGLMIITGILVLLRSQHQQGLMVVGVLLLACAALPNLVETVIKGNYGTLLTNTGKSFTLGSGAFLVLSTFNYGTAQQRTAFLVVLRSSCRYCLGIFLLASGIQHFLFADFVQLLIPVWIPGAAFWVYASGVFLILSGLLLLIGWRLVIVGKIISLVILCWFFVLHLPRAIGEAGNSNEWTAAFEALAFSGLAYLLSELRVIGGRQSMVQ
ncbi:DoxX family membrane protein [Paraflavitalea pollutisoli]|uniref:DoxX family membrane protein n=1 Tax=Paraflavitalea pollutisoli TaxID=3034143 RepID=UPI0023EC832B|nr:DoxX family membrane protein [Paraflavitalea sp. H1-2-19X]